MNTTLQVLRQAGFFKNYVELSNEEIIDKIHEERKAQYSEIFGYVYDPGRTLSDQKLAEWDDTKMLHFDTEADVGSGNNVYVWLTKALSKLSGIDNLITSVEEEWENETGPIKVSFSINQNLMHFEPEYMDDWIDPNFIDFTLRCISKVTGESFHICFGPDSEWIGQDVNYLRLNVSEKEILKEKLHWKFEDDFMEEMNKSL